jgi:hypothetical protein
VPQQRVTTVRPDSKGRITLGRLLKGVSSLSVTVDDDGRIILEPYQEVPQREAWLYQNRAALEQLRAGIQQAAEGSVHDVGSFAQYADDSDLEQ